mmetsp:Transcript_11514/g.17599  ORF Transcript_11514/g.17599 Transcript_11514/m.17599 type:complete len:81 (+) Transcript_11514:489-731(+)
MHPTKTGFAEASGETMEEGLLVASLSGMSLEAMMAKYHRTAEILPFGLDLPYHIDLALTQESRLASDRCCMKLERQITTP